MSGPFKLKNKKDFNFGNKGNINKPFNIKKGKINQPVVASWIKEDGEWVDKDFMTNQVKRAQGKEITVK